MIRLRHLFLLVACTDILVAQQTLVVGAGQPFATIPAAIAAASPGDTVLVLAGTYTQVLDINKGVRIVGRGANLQISTFPTFVAVTVHDVPAGQTFALSGFNLTGVGTSIGLVVRDCAGTVALRDLQGGVGGRWGVAAIRAQQVHIGSSFLYGLNATDSQVVCERCLMEPAAFAAVNVTGSTVILVGCTVPGGNGPFGGPGVNMNSGTLVATRTEIRGSIGGFPAIATSAGSLLLDPSTVLVPSGASPLISGPVLPTSFEVASVEAHTNGTQLTVDSHGTAGALFATVVSVAAPQSATQIGLTWLDPSSATVFYFANYAVVDRRHNITIPHPVLPAGIVFAVQSVHFAPLGPAFGTPSLFTTP